MSQALGVTTAMLGHNLMNLLHSAYFHILFWLIIIDIISGYAKAFILHKYSSSVGINGILKHVLVLFTMCILGVYARIFGFSSVSIGVCVFFIANYAGSIVENWGEIGLPLPSWVKKYIARLQEMSDKGNSSGKGEKK